MNNPAAANRYVIRFSECEHSGDLANYAADVRRCGARIVAQRVDVEAEEGFITIEVSDLAAFRAAFDATEAGDFSNGILRESEAGEWGVQPTYKVGDMWPGLPVARPGFGDIYRNR